MLATMKERLAYFSKERDFFIPNFVRKIKEQLFSAFLCKYAVAYKAARKFAEGFV